MNASIEKWQPQLEYADGSVSTLSLFVGFYTKIDKLVYIYASISVSGVPSGISEARLTCLPFKSSILFPKNIPICVSTQNIIESNRFDQIVAEVERGADYIRFMSYEHLNPSASNNVLTQKNMKNGTSLTINGMYLID